MKHTTIARNQENASRKAQLPSTRKRFANSPEAQAARERYLATLRRIGQPEIVLERYDTKGSE